MNGMALLLTLIVLGMLWGVRRLCEWMATRHSDPYHQISEPRSQVRVLTTREAVDKAVERALDYEHAAHDVVERRIERYERSRGTARAGVVVRLTTLEDKRAAAVRHPA